MVLRWRICNKPGCGNLTPNSGKCDDCQREADLRRGSKFLRGYAGRGHRNFRIKVLRRDKICVLCKGAPATDADHYPVDRRTLELRGENPNDPRHGRGLCGLCHKKETARLQPGGWNATA